VRWAGYQKSSLTGELEVFSAWKSKRDSSLRGLRSE
jgi:hypothetical protein